MKKMQSQGIERDSLDYHITKSRLWGGVDSVLSDHHFTGKVRPITVLGTFPAEYELFVKMMAVFFFIALLVAVLL